jgi:hypothetical protein
MAGKGSAPGERRGGRKKGTPNKSTASVKAALLECFEGWGGVASLLKWAKKNPTEFVKAWVKMLPAEHELRGGLVLKLVEEIVEASGNHHTNGQAPSRTVGVPP